MSCDNSTVSCIARVSIFIRMSYLVSNILYIKGNMMLILQLLIFNNV